MLRSPGSLHENVERVLGALPGPFGEAIGRHHGDRTRYRRLIKAQALKALVQLFRRLVREDNNVEWGGVSVDFAARKVLEAKHAQPLPS